MDGDSTEAGTDPSGKSDAETPEGNVKEDGREEAIKWEALAR